MFSILSLQSILFQLTTSHRGRLPFLNEFQLRYYFNSLPHTEVDSIRVSSHCHIYTFQLTTSHRGRHWIVNTKIQNNYFNSLPHTEVDRCFLSAFTRTAIFQLTTSHRGRQQFVTKFRKNFHESHNKSHNKSLFFSFQASYNNYKTQKSSLFLVRISQKNYVYFTFALQNQCPCNIKSRMCSYVFDFVFVIISQVIKPQTVDFFIYDFLKNIFYYQI